MSLKRILNDEESLDADGGRYGQNANFQRSMNEQAAPRSPGISLPPISSHSDTLYSVSNGTTFTEDGFSQLQEHTALDNSQVHHDQLSGVQLVDDFTSTLSNAYDFAKPELAHFDLEPSSTLQNLNSTTTFVGTSASQNAPEIICYGSVYRTAVRLSGDMLRLDEKLQRTEGSEGFGFASFELQPGNEEITLHFTDGSHLGSTNTHFVNGFRGVFPRDHVRMAAVVNVGYVRDAIRKARKASDAIIRVDVNVFGPKQNAAEVGRMLSDGKIWLQKPDIPKKGFEYDNPQFLNLDGYERSEFDLQPLEVTSNQKRLDFDENEFEEAVENVFNKLTRSDQLQRVEKDQRVKTKLLRHQEEGLDFMIQREGGDIEERFRLWTREEDESVVLYRHAVTGATSHTYHPEAGGGVLADDMGMGKSLSILSLVTKTSDQAAAWSRGAEGPDETPGNLNLRSKATLIVVSSALMISEWIHEISKHLHEGCIHMVKYHGAKRRSLNSMLQSTDVILTTYNTLARDFHFRRRRKYDSRLHEIEFYRVVLDEAHVIRRKSTLFNKAVSELSAKSRWCLTGTPIQNRFEDIGALFAFIRARPFHNIGMFRRFISNPFNESNEQRTTAVNRLATLIDSLCIRRTKARLQLPKSQDLRRELKFSDAEQLQYAKSVSDMSRSLKQQAGNLASVYDFGLFHINLQLRILCNHGTYQRPFAWLQNAWLDVPHDALISMEGIGEAICSYCKQTMPITSARNIYRTYGDPCGHAICDLCSPASLDEKEEDETAEIPCPICAQAEVLRANTGGTSATKRVPDEYYFLPNGYSTKMAYLVNDLKEDLDQKKSVVFSCWTRTLELISRHLKAAQIPFERIDGSISLRQRELILEAFDKRDDLPVLIMTTGTGAYGLNLTAASRVFIIEPQWNPALENQALSRAIRLGQENNVQVIRYIMKGTVEQDMRSQQNRKITIARILDQGANARSEERDSESEHSDAPMAGYD
ncbi:hypothetical protein K402DRAFT_422775 [Aulographum hederae CBS 113979]|uniref:Uncharacterized protein n=1 Tax=Aulographum hederae CBS 113979 TaxID=1176131 RepID=A0A6G1GUS3_9PEZI|nr:hypothetical protein K402DRAFT_422775 [Aulographum hederae CBS 113979]